MATDLLERLLTMPKPKRNDVPVKVDAEVVRKARIVAASKGLSLAAYLSERLRPLVVEDLLDFKHSDDDLSPPRKPKKGGGQ